MPQFEEPRLPTVIHRIGSLLLGSDSSDKPAARFMVECEDCHDTSDPVDDVQRITEAWALNHAAENPGHEYYQLTAHRFWRVTRGPARDGAAAPAHGRVACAGGEGGRAGGVSGT
ncbi:DUF7848 domain-containing protein [Streptomyces sp. NPDC055094]